MCRAVSKAGCIAELGAVPTAAPSIATAHAAATIFWAASALTLRLSNEATIILSFLFDLRSARKAKCREAEDIDFSDRLKRRDAEPHRANRRFSQRPSDRRFLRNTMKFVAALGETKGLKHDRAELPANNSGPSLEGGSYIAGGDDLVPFCRIVDALMVKKMRSIRICNEKSRVTPFRISAASATNRPLKTEA